MSNKQTAVDIFHDRVIEMLGRKRPFTTNEVAKVWADLKELERKQIIAAHDGFPIHARGCQDGEEYYKIVYED